MRPSGCSSSAVTPAGMSAAVAGAAPRASATSSRSSRSSAARYTSYVGVRIARTSSATWSHDADELIARTPRGAPRNGIDVQLEHEVVAHRRRRPHGARARSRHRGDETRRAVRPARDRDRRDADAARPARHRRARHPRHPDPRRRHRPARRRRRAPRRDAGGRRRRRLHRARDGRGAAPARARGARSSSRRAADGTLDPDMGALVADAIRGSASTAHRDARSTGSRPATTGVVRGASPPTARSPADIVVLGIGVQPERRRSRATPGIDDRRRAAASSTDARMATSVERHLGRGRLRRVDHRVTRPPVAIALGTHANKQGRVVGINVDRRLRDVRRRRRHRGDEDLRRTRSDAPASPSAKPREAGFDVRHRHDRVHHARRLLPGRRDRSR